MKFKEKLYKLTKVSYQKLPSSYQIIGDVLLLKLPKVKLNKQKQDIAKAILKILPYVKTVCEIKEVSGELRKPKIKKLVGSSTETIHKEHGILYKLNVSKIMFSKGNLTERKRLIEEAKPGEVIVDMFAGIGYFSLGLAKTHAKIYSIEKNKNAFRYLQENIRLNKTKNIKPIEGDCRKVKIPEKADRVLMGYFPGTEKYLPAAIGFLKDKGIIHYHDLGKSEDDIVKRIKKYTKEQKIKILSKKIVKSYAPHIYHFVVDFYLEKGYI